VTELFAGGPGELPRRCGGGAEQAAADHRGRARRAAAAVLRTAAVMVPGADGGRQPSLSHPLGCD